MSPEMIRSSHGREGDPFSIPAIEKEQSPNFAEDRGTSRRFLDEDRSLLSAAEVTDVVRHKTIIILLFYTIAYKHSL